MKTDGRKGALRTPLRSPKPQTSHGPDARASLGCLCVWQSHTKRDYWSQRRPQGGFASNKIPEKSVFAKNNQSTPRTVLRVPLWLGEATRVPKTHHKQARCTINTVLNLPIPESINQKSPRRRRRVHHVVLHKGAHDRSFHKSS